MITRLLVWALAIVAIDGVVIVTKDGSDAPSAQTAQATSTTTTASTGGTSTTTTSTATGPTPTTTATEQPTSTTVAGGDGPTTTVDTAPTTVGGTSPSSPCVVPPGPGEVAHVHCDGETASTVTFHVNGGWRLRWTVDPGIGVAATVTNNATQESYFVPMNPPSGESGFVDGCDCTLQLVPDGSAYDVVVVDG